MKKITISLFCVCVVVAIPAFAQQASYHVELQDGSKVQGKKVELRTKLFTSPKLVVDDTTVFSVSTVKAFQNEEGYFRRIRNTDNDFAQRLEKGNIDLYTKSVTMYYQSSWVTAPGGTSIYTGVGGPVKQDVQYFSKNEGELMKATPANLRTALADNQLSMSYMNKRGGLAAIQVLGAIAGITITAIATSNAIEAENPNPVPLVLGVGVFTGSIWIPHFAKQELNRKAIRAYNQPESVW